jgi:hypothetical protein
MITRRQFLHISLAATALAGCSNDDSLTPAPTESASDSNSGDDHMPKAPKIVVNLPLLDALWELDPIIRERFPGDYRDGIAAVGIGFAKSNEFKHGDYYCTPKNSVAFAWSGGDGEHYSFIVRNNKVDADSPVILTAPANSGDENHLIADNFQNFLRLGLRRGFFGIGQFAYDPDEALAAYGNPDWVPTKKSHYSVGFVPDDRQLQVLSFVAEALGLQPLSYTSEEYAKLQARLAELIRNEIE